MIVRKLVTLTALVFAILMLGTPARADSLCVDVDLSDPTATVSVSGPLCVPLP